MHLGYPSAGHLSTYYPDSPDITQEEIDYVSEFLKEQKLLPENTRLQKLKSGDFDVLVASATSNPSEHDTEKTEWTLEGPLKGKKLRLVYGDHKVEMDKIAIALKEAEKYAANDNEKAMQSGELPRGVPSKSLSEQTTKLPQSM